MSQLSTLNIQEMKQITGENTSSFPFIPKIKPNNPQNEEQSQKYPNNFIITRKGDDGYVVENFDNSFVGTILLVRYVVKHATDKPTWFSRECDNFKIDTIRTFDNETKNVIFEGSYDQFKQKYSTFDSEGNKVSSMYDLYVHIYTLIGDDIHRIVLRGTSRSAWFDFSNKAIPSHQSWLQFPITFATKDEEGKAGMYRVITFTKGEKYDDAQSNDNFNKTKELRAALSMLSAAPLPKDTDKEVVEFLPKEQPHGEVGGLTAAGIPKPPRTSEALSDDKLDEANALAQLESEKAKDAVDQIPFN